MNTKFRFVTISFIIVLTIFSVAQQVKATGDQIRVVISPNIPQPVGACFDATIFAEGNFRSVRLRVANGNWQETNQLYFSRRFCTENFSPGIYYVQVEVSLQNDTRWQYPIRVQYPFILYENRQTFTLSVYPTQLGPGEILTVSWKNSSPTNKDWITMYIVGAADDSFVDWRWANGSEGAIYFLAPQQQGQYEFRYFRNGVKVAVSSPFSVVVREQVKCPQCQESRGGVHVAYICAFWGRGGGVVEPSDALSWKCADGLPVSFFQACLDAYGSNRPYATLANWRDVYGWRCSNTPGPISRP